MTFNRFSFWSCSRQFVRSGDDRYCTPHDAAVLWLISACWVLALPMCFWTRVSLP